MTRNRFPRALGTPWAVTTFIVATLAIAYYAIEPWAATFVDDGPYFSVQYTKPVDDLPLHSSVELRRFGLLCYVLESRTVIPGEQSVLVLKKADGEPVWARTAVKPDGELGTVEVLRAYVTWYGGWRVAIAPSNQEGGNLYLSLLGKFRFLNHSW